MRSSQSAGGTVAGTVIWVVFLAYCFLIVFLSHQSKPFGSCHITTRDYVLHFAEYMVLGMLAVRAFSVARLSFLVRYSVRLSVVFSVLFGISDEMHQWFIPGRFCSLKDVGADVCGALLGITYVCFVERMRFKKS